MWAWLNPKNLIQVLTLLKYLVDGAKAIYNSFVEWNIKRKQQKEIKQAEEAAEELEESNKIKDEHERLKRKAEAACKLEKSINPNSDCDHKSGK